jgi:hypothetical protein
VCQDGLDEVNSLLVNVLNEVPISRLMTREYILQVLEPT